MHRSEKTEFPVLSPPSEQANFNCNYQELQAGINRLRYIKKKQQKHHNIMAQHLQNLLHKIEQHRTPSSLSTPSHPLATPPQKLRDNFKYDPQQHSPYSNKKSRIPFSLLARTQSGFILPLKKSPDRNPQQLGSCGSRPHTKEDREKRLLSRQQYYMKKQENCQQMRQLRQQRQHKKRELFQERIIQARERKAKIIISQQQGRKKLQEQYYRHLQQIKTEKRAQKQRKDKLNELKCHRLMEIQKKEEQQLAVFQKSLVLEESLRDYLVEASSNLNNLNSNISSNMNSMCREAINTDVTLTLQ